MESVTSLTKSSLGAKVRAVSKRVEREWAGEIICHLPKGEKSSFDRELFGFGTNLEIEKNTSHLRINF